MILTDTLDQAIAEPAIRYEFDHLHAGLSGAVEQLAGLRFSILLSAKWLGSSVLTGHARTELREELRQLRSCYSSKIDEIAINYGVQAAMGALDGVEREVGVPKNMTPPLHCESAGFHDI